MWFDLNLGGWEREIARGAAMTIGLALAALPFGLAIGLGVALAKDARASWLRAGGEVYTTIFRGVPELLTLLLIYYGLQIGLQKLGTAVGLPLAFDMPPFVAGVIALSLVFGAYSSEVLLAALRGVEIAQIETARSFGMSPMSVFLRIKAPQMIRIALPGLGNNWLVLLKDTSIVSVIALEELLRKTAIAVESTREPFKFYAVACVLYLLFTAISTLALARAERWARRGWVPSA